MEPAIKVENVYKDFVLPHNRANTLKSTFLKVFTKSGVRNEMQHALQGVSFEVKKGEFFGIVGRNGSGKSTLLKMLAGIYQPTKGKITVNGKLVPFIELGVGFNPELTGRENVYLNSAILGFSEKQVDAMYDDIVEFSELERFMDQKLKNYSSGMQVRLAFSVAIRANSDILLIDEVLAVGDADFQRKCFDYFRKLKKTKVTVVFVSHNMDAIREFCDRAMLIDKTRILEINTTDNVADHYKRLFIQDSKKVVKHEEEQIKRWGDGMVQIQRVYTNKKSYNSEKEPEISVYISAKGKENTNDNLSIGFLIKNLQNKTILGSNTFVQKQFLGKSKKGCTYKICWRVPNIFGDGAYSIEAAVTSTDGNTVHDWIQEACIFKVFREVLTPYVVTPNMPVQVQINEDSD